MRTLKNRKTKIKRKSRDVKKSLDISGKATIDNKLTHKALLLTYAFDYGINFNERIINITGDIEFPMFDFLDAAMTEMESNGGSAITIKIHSGGGDVYEAMAIVGRLLQSKCAIHTIGYGHVMSAACLILACGKKGKRKLSRLSEFMWHEASYGIEGRHSQIKHNVAQMEREEKKWALTMAEFTKKSPSFWIKEGVGLDAFFNAKDLLKLGVVDELF